MRYNEEAAIASRCVTTYSKLAYYTAFTIAYGLVGRLASLVMKNFTGTKDYVCCGAASRGRCGRFIPPLTRLGYRILVCCRISGGGDTIISIMCSIVCCRISGGGSGISDSGGRIRRNTIGGYTTISIMCSIGCCRISGGGIGHGTRDYIWAEGHWLLHEHRQRHRMLRLGWEAAW
mmetsp:Transcript_27039/g.32776  ORF Transcript_27039/g.32776 Transcript_27039/m.32776 type:complete len:176 (+) Transcript_27039:4-531(+)